MLLLVLAHRHQVGLVEHDIRRHQGGIGEQTGVDVVGVAGGLVLELGHAGQLAEHGVAVEHPGQLRVGGHMGLDEEDGLLRVDAAGHQLGKELNGLAAEGGGVLTDGDGVLIHHAVDAVVLILHGHPVAQRTQIVAQMEGAAGLDAAENDFFIGFHNKFTPL